MSSLAASERDMAGRDRVGGPVIDVDVHEMLSSVSELAPYLEEPWRSRITMPDGWQGLPGFPYSYPQVGGLARADAVLENGAPAGSSYERLREQVLDAYPIEHAILTGLFHPTDIGVQPEFAAALASAYNDWLIDNWLRRDERLLGSIAVAAQAPETAAREIDRVGGHEQIVQVMLPASSRDVLGRAFYAPLYEAAVRHDLVVGFHQTNDTHTAVGLPPYYIEWHTAIPQAWQSQLIGLVFDDRGRLDVAAEPALAARPELPQPASRGPVGQANAQRVREGERGVLLAADGVPGRPPRPVPDVRDGGQRSVSDVRHRLSPLGLRRARPCDPAGIPR
jgi:predicted TIM-barrel fold metal-dependent hydrolase